MRNTGLILFIGLIQIAFGLNFAESDGLSLNGRVIHSFTHEPLAYATITFPETSAGAISDENGEFNVSVPSNAAEIQISYLGYKTQLIKITEINVENFLIIRMVPKDILLQEVAIYNTKSSNYEKVEVSSLSLQTDRIEKISNAMPDVLRSFQSLPGISANNEFSAEFNVRGGNKDENLIQVNGTQVYEPYHLKEAQNASVGVFNVELIDKVNIVTGGFSARYGDRLSSVANIEYREGNNYQLKGAATLSLAFIDGYIEGPLFKDASIIAAARKTYMEYVKEITDFGYSEVKSAEPTFYDIQGVYSQKFSNSSKLKLSFIHSGDNWTYNPGADVITSNFEKQYFSQQGRFQIQTLTENTQNANYYSSLIDLQLTNILGKDIFLKNSISYYDQRDHENFVTRNVYTEDIYANDHFFISNTNTHLYNYDLTIKTLEFAAEVNYQLSPYYDIKSGLQYKKLFYDQNNLMNRIVNNSAYTPEFIDTFNTSFVSDLAHLSNIDNAYSYKNSGYVENIIQIKDNVILNIAGRFDYFDMNKETTYSPRFNIAYSTDFGTVFRAAWGHYYQTPIYTQLKYSNSSPNNTKSQMAIHYVAGVEQDFNLSHSKISTLKVKLDLYYKDYQNLISSYYSHYSKLFYSRNNDATGFAKGIDTYILLNIPRFYTWVSYGYLVAMEDEKNDNKGAYQRLTGQTHTFSWVTDFNLGNGWSLNSKYYYGSGFPYAEKTLYYYKESNEYIWESEPNTTSILPAYSRLDFRISKMFKLSNYALNTFFEISNALNHKNIRGYEYSFDSKGNPKITEIALWPLLPSFGIKVEF